MDDPERSLVPEGSPPLPVETTVSEEEAKKRAKRALIWTPPLTALAMYMFYPEPVAVLGMAGLGVFAVVMLIREMRSPDRFLRRSPDEVAKQVLAERHRLAEVTGLEGLAELEEIRDALHPLYPGGKWFGRHGLLVVRAVAIGLALLVSVVTVLAVVAGFTEALGLGLVGILFAWVWWWFLEHGTEERRKAAALVEDAIDQLELP